MSNQTTPAEAKTPKQRFQLNATAVAEHSTLLSTPSYQRAIDYSLQQYANELAADIKDGNSAAATGFKLQGAVDFIRVMRTLAESPAKQQPMFRKDLDHTV